LIDGSIRDCGIDRGIFYHFKRFLLKRANLVIGNSSAGLSAYKTKGQVLYNAINSERFNERVIAQEFNVIMTANFTEYKDHLTFLNAAIPLLQDHTVDNVFLVGEGPFKEKYISWISTEHPELFSRFHFTGAVFNVEEYLARCHVGVLCSTPEYSEGLSNSVLEYMAAGLVPIVTNLGGSKEIVEDDINGYLINPRDDKKIVELIHLLKNSPSIRMQIIEQAKATIENKFSLKKNLDTLSLIYTNLWNKN
jgi:glycosyltransferase involved in cell wall biosynthesis